MVLPVGIIFYFFPREILLLILGNNWVSVAPVLKVLVLLGVVRSLTNSAFPLFLSFKKQNYIAYITFINVCILAVLVIPFTTSYGLIGTAYAVDIAAVAVVPVTMYYLYKLLW